MDSHTHAHTHTHICVHVLYIYVCVCNGCASFIWLLFLCGRQPCVGCCRHAGGRRVRLTRTHTPIMPIHAYTHTPIRPYSHTPYIQHQHTHIPTYAQHPYNLTPMHPQTLTPVCGFLTGCWEWWQCFWYDGLIYTCVHPCTQTPMHPCTHTPIHNTPIHPYAHTHAPIHP